MGALAVLVLVSRRKPLVCSLYDYENKVSDLDEIGSLATSYSLDSTAHACSCSVLGPTPRMSTVLVRKCLCIASCSISSCMIPPYVNLSVHTDWLVI